MKTKKNIVKVMVATLLSAAILSQTAYASTVSHPMEKYVRAKAVENGTTYEYELEKERNQIIPLTDTEYIDYITKSQQAGTIRTNLGNFSVTISTEAKVVVDRATRKVINVLDFGAPNASVSRFDTQWVSGGFNKNRQDDKSCRISSTGQFIINGPGLSIGASIISVSVYGTAKTEIMTISTTMRW